MKAYPYEQKFHPLSLDFFPLLLIPFAFMGLEVGYRTLRNRFGCGSGVQLVHFPKDSIGCTMLIILIWNVPVEFTGAGKAHLALPSSTRIGIIYEGKVALVRFFSNEKDWDSVNFNIFILLF